MESDAVWSGTQAPTSVEAAESSKPLYTKLHLLKQQSIVRVHPHSHLSNNRVFKLDYLVFY